MPRQPHVAGLSEERRVVVVESGGSSFTLVLATLAVDEVVVGKRALTRELSRSMAREKEARGLSAQGYLHPPQRHALGGLVENSRDGFALKMMAVAF